ncbi:MAG: hypothetical protein ACK58T_32755, partial [Phycisphaerae bacterium]
MAFSGSLHLEIPAPGPYRSEPDRPIRSPVFIWPFGPLPFAICHLPFAICHSPFAIRHSPSTRCPHQTADGFSKPFLWISSIHWIARFICVISCLLIQEFENPLEKDIDNSLSIQTNSSSVD